MGLKEVHVDHRLSLEKGLARLGGFLSLFLLDPGNSLCGKDDPTSWTQSHFDIRYSIVHVNPFLPDNPHPHSYQKHRFPSLPLNHALLSTLESPMTTKTRPTFPRTRRLQRNFDLKLHYRNGHHHPNSTNLTPQNLSPNGRSELLLNSSRPARFRPQRLPIYRCGPYLLQRPLPIHTLPLPTLSSLGATPAIWPSNWERPKIRCK